jgi:hypothetical protein
MKKYFSALPLQRFAVSLYVVMTMIMSVSASETMGTIDGTSHSAKVCHNDACTTYGTINFLPSGTQAPVSITDTAITGYVWGDQMGWINLAPSGAGVTVDPVTGLLYGTAWSQSSGWINFRPTTNAGVPAGGIPVGVSITSSGELYGWAWNGGAYGGWIKFDCSNLLTCVKTDWRKVGSRTQSSQTLVMGGSYFINRPTSEASPRVLTETNAQQGNSASFLGGISISSSTSITLGGSTSTARITKTLKQGMTHAEVKLLQSVLAEDKAIYPLGLVSGYFGSATKRAVQAFQIKYMIAKAGEAGYGSVGPKTRAKLNEFLAKKKS